jgi:hypothetical protein
LQPQEARSRPASAHRDQSVELYETADEPEEVIRAEPDTKPSNEDDALSLTHHLTGRGPPWQRIAVGFSLS